MDKQTAKLIARISENLPHMSSYHMQMHINDPVGLQKALWKALCPIRIIDVTTNGRSGEQCIADLKEKHYRLGDHSDHCEELLRSKQFIATNGVTYSLAIIMGYEFEDESRIYGYIGKRAEKHGCVIPPVEVAPYLRELVSDDDLKKMGLQELVIMHEPIDVSGDILNVLSISRYGDGRLLLANSVRRFRSGNWPREFGFAYLAPSSS